jgi:hypothetical protein
MTYQSFFSAPSDMTPTTTRNQRRRSLAVSPGLHDSEAAGGVDARRIAIAAPATASGSQGQ